MAESNGMVTSLKSSQQHKSVT